MFIFFQNTERQIDMGSHRKFAKLQMFYAFVSSILIKQRLFCGIKYELLFLVASNIM